jgi:hypothetical protein
MSDLTHWNDSTPKQDLALVARAMREGWHVEPELKALMIDRAVATLRNPMSDTREVSRASDFLLAVDKHALELLKTEDNMNRLDGGQATGRIELLPITFEKRD